jgi:uncharacterized membrane protein YdjX (TVP38/TMEM64 family)
LDQLNWLRLAAAAAVGCAMVAAWKWAPMAWWDPHAIAAWAAPHRQAWYALPLVMMAFVALAVVPASLLIAATGVAFGPVLGPIYAMAGCLASASTGFALGRWMGQRRVSQLGGERIARVSRSLRRNGTLAVFFIRKVPVPFILTNIVVGASAVGYRDFLIGTLLGMGAFVIALAGFGYQLTRALRDPTPGTLAGAAVLVGIPLTLALVINRVLRRARPAE